MRRLRPVDLLAVRAINAAGQPGVAALTPEELAALAAGTILCWVAIDAAAIAGYLIVYTSGDAYDGEEFAWFQHHYQHFLYVDQIAIAPEHRHSGVGSALYQFASAYAAGEGLDALVCEVNLDPPNPISLAFHHGRGFERVGTLQTRDGRTVALLRLELAPSTTTSGPA